MVRVGSGGRAYVLGDTRAAVERRAPPRRLVVSRAEPAAACSRRADQLRRVSPRRDQRRERCAARSSTVRSGLRTAARRARRAPRARAQRPPSRQTGAATAARRPCRAPTAYVTAMGQLFSRSRQRGPIAARYAEELKRRIGSATGVDWHLDDASFCAAIAVTGDRGCTGTRGTARARADAGIGATRGERAAAPRPRRRCLRASLDGRAGRMIDSVSAQGTMPAVATQSDAAALRAALHETMGERSSASCRSSTGSTSRCSAAATCSSRACPGRRRR